MLGEEQQAIQTNRTQIGFGTHLERGKKSCNKKNIPSKVAEITSH